MQEKLNNLHAHSAGLLGCCLACWFIQSIYGLFLFIGFFIAVVIVGIKKAKLKRHLGIKEKE